MQDKKCTSDCGCKIGHVDGIVCDVKNCAYHASETECYAGKVSIGPKSASCSANTVCATFKPKES